MAHTPIIREATRDDVFTLLAFMHATATERGNPDAVTATPSELIDTLCLTTPTSAAADSGASKAPVGNAHAVFIVTPEGEIAGMAIYYTTYVAWKAKSGLCLEDLYVLPAYRRRKYARVLAQHVAREARRLDCARIDWLCYKNNQRALSFYRSLGAKEMDAITLLQLDRDAVDQFVEDG